MARLPEKDRNAILLHFFENQPLADVGAALGLTPDSARMRVSRALEKLKGFLTRRGVALSVGTLGTLLSANAIQAAPIGLASSLAPMALIGGTTASLALAKATLSTMTWLKVKTATYVGGACLLAAGGTALVVALLSLSWVAPKTPANASSSVPFSVQGTLTYEVPGRPVLSSYFTASVSNSSWHITVVMEGNTSILSSEYRYDGINNLHYSIFQRTGSDVGSGLVELGAVPSSTGSDAGEVIWLAYASGAYFRGLKGGTATSLEPLRGHGFMKRHEVPAAWKLAPKAPFSPIEISYFATNVSVLDDAGRLVSIPLDKPRAPKYVAGHLRTWESVTFQNITIPRHFEYVSYGPWPRPGTPGRGCIVRGFATNVCSLIPFPKLPSTLHLQDNRVPEPRVVYKVTDGNIPPVMQMRTRASTAVFMPPSCRPPRTGSGWRYLAFAVPNMCKWTQ